MKLYHTSDRVIRQPDVRHGRLNTDFGQGFYLTPDREFARRWAGRNAVLNEYEFDESGLSVYRFARDTDWFQYIFRNRRATDGRTEDVITGPIANDTIFDTFGILSSGFLKPDEALALLQIGPAYTQVALKTERAAAQLRWTGAETLTGIDEEMRRQEQKEYQASLAAAMAALNGEDGEMQE